VPVERRLLLEEGDVEVGGCVVDQCCKSEVERADADTEEVVDVIGHVFPSSKRSRSQNMSSPVLSGRSTSCAASKPHFLNTRMARSFRMSGSVTMRSVSGCWNWKPTIARTSGPPYPRRGTRAGR